MPYPANIFVTKMLSAFYVCFLYYFRQDFTMEANTMNPDQTAWEQSDLGPYCS